MLKILVRVLLLLIVIAISAYFYIFRQQELAVRFIPNEFEYCGKTISVGDKSYEEIVRWLKKNKNGWVLSYVTYVPRMVYRHPAFIVNVLEDGVVVSYKTDYGYPQYARTVAHSLNTQCAPNS